MSRKMIEGDDGVRKTAEMGMPGWQALQDKDSRSSSGDITADFTGRDIAALKAKYLGAAADASPSRYSNEDAHFVQLRPKDSDSPVQTRSAVVFGKEVVGFQG